MARNVEIKARIEADQFEGLRQRAREIATAGPVRLEQTDTFFQSACGRLKLREVADGAAELIFYQRPDDQGPKTSSYVRSECPSPSTMKAALAEANGILGVVKKQRELFLVGRTRIHLDRVEKLGTFLELEVVLGEPDSEEQGEQVARELIEQFNVSVAQWVSVSYFDLLCSAETAT